MSEIELMGMTDNLPPLPHPVRHDFVGDDTEDLYTADQMSAYAAQAVAAERERCAQIVSAYRVPVGNSAADEMAAEWTMDALREIRDAIRGV